MSEYTKGPWSIDQDDRPGYAWNRHIYGPDGLAICFMAHSGEKFKSAKDEANATLVAAAPDLLSAAEEALLLLQKGKPGWGVAKDLLNAAIKKATQP